MQTFLPYADFARSARALDYRRLGKQRVEARQILAANAGLTRGWVHHPVTKMWRGFDDALKLYFDAVSDEWISRGYKHTMGFYRVPGEVEMPSFVGDEEFHRAHRELLIRKKPEYYEAIFK